MKASNHNNIRKKNNKRLMCERLETIVYLISKSTYSLLISPINTTCFIIILQCYQTPLSHVRFYLLDSPALFLPVVAYLQRPVRFCPLS